MICLQLTLLFLLLWQGSSQELEPVFRPVGSVVELGYCFGEDYIVVYRVTQEGDILLGNSSAESPPLTLPSDFQGRVHTSQNHHLLGLQIKNLTQRDSGVYRRECWKHQMMVKLQTQQLSVCNAELESQEVSINPKEEGVEIRCNSSAIGQAGVSVHWYHDVYPSYTIVLLLDSSISLDPVPGILEVKNNGATLVLDKSMLSHNQHFYCLAQKDSQCLSFQDLYVPESLESRDVFASNGDKVVLYCKADGNDQYWETPNGRIENTDERNHHMFISSDEEAQHFSLVIHMALSEHFGDYSCVSATSELQYSLVLCPKEKSLEAYTFENHVVTLKCHIGQVDSYMVQWYRRQELGQQELIFDSGDDSVPLPDDLRGRVTLSGEDSELTLLEVKRADEGLYWCVVIKGAVFFDDEDEYTDEYEDEDDSEWGEKCLFKQETFLSVSKTPVVPTPNPGPRSGQGSFTIGPRRSKANGHYKVTVVLKLMMISVFAMFVL